MVHTAVPQFKCKFRSLSSFLPSPFHYAFFCLSEQKPDLQFIIARNIKIRLSKYLEIPSYQKKIILDSDR